MRTTGILVRKRLTWIFLLSVLAFSGLVVRLAWIQFVKGDYYQERAMEVRMRDIPVEAKRGSIYDRNGNELVTSVSADSIYAIPSQIKDPGGAARALAPLLEMDEGKLSAMLSRKSSFEWIKRKVDAGVAQKVKQMSREGIYLVEESQRHYLHETLATHLLGFTGVDSQGLTGIEKSFDDVLKGQPGRIMVEQDAAGRKLPDPINKYSKPQQGNSLVLTLDETIQYFVERELDKIMATYQPRLAVVMVMDTSTGEVLAMGNRPTFNSNSWNDAPKSVWDRNPAIWYNYEPGSTFKVITTAAGLNEGVVQESDRFFDPGYAKVADRRIRCWKPGGHGSQSFEEVVKNSCNPGFIELGLKVGKDNYYKYVKNFGFGVKTGIDIPGEATGILIPEKSATNLNIATMSIGQSIAVTPVQLLTATCAIANGGNLLKPQLVKEVRDSQGKIIKTYQPEIIRRVMSPEAASRERALLEKVVAQGTGRNAFVEGYRVAGKTGTAQVVGESGGYVSGRYVASFVGFAPADKPRFAMLIMIAEPQGGVYYGGQVAAPIFQAIARDILHYMKVPGDPSLQKPKGPLDYYQQPKVQVNVPQVVNYPLHEAIRILRGWGLNAQTNGEGSVVYGQMPKGGALVYNGTTVLLNLTPPGGTGAAQTVTVPNLQGLTLNEARDLLESLGLHLEALGTGFVTFQEPGPGTRVGRGGTVKTELSPPGTKPPANIPDHPVMSNELIMD